MNRMYGTKAHWQKFLGVWIRFASPVNFHLNSALLILQEHFAASSLFSQTATSRSPSVLRVGSRFSGVISGLQLCLYQHCLWMGTKVGWGPGTLSQTTTATATASFQRYTGKPERWRQEQRHGEPGKLFYIIPRHNRANLSVCAHTYTCWNREEKESYTILCVFSRFRLGTFSGFPWI